LSIAPAIDTTTAWLTWFITGTSTGFGRSLTEALLARGDRVAATLRRPAVVDGLPRTPICCGAPSST
jgi:NADP-dependent 3-hydroxy acid dehydrogenase YdfG